MRVLAIVQEADAGPGVFADAVAARGDELDEWLIADGDPPADPHGYDAAMVFGGSMNVDEEDAHPWLGDQKTLLRALLVNDVPLLAVCLGAQLLAEAAGEEPRRAPRPEIGWHPVELTVGGREDPLLGVLPTAFAAFQWHSYEMGLDDGEILARSDVCAQAARFGPLAWAIQFHAEVTERDALKWIADYESDPDAVALGVDPEALAAETSEKIGAWNREGRALAARFLELAREREHAALRGGVGDLRDGGAEHGDEGGDVDDRAAGALEHVRYPVLAAEEDPAQVDVLDPLPGLERGVEDRLVVGRVDPGVVHQDVDPAHLLADPGVGVADLVLVGDVGLDRELALGLGLEVDADDARALGREQPRRLGADPARGAGDDADPVLQTSSHQPSSVA
jgi:GMP synthase-like glutamine amidotransferase